MSTQKLDEVLGARKLFGAGQNLSTALLGSGWEVDWMPQSPCFLQMALSKSPPNSRSYLWHHELNGHEFEQALEDGEEQGSLVCLSLWGCKESDTTERLNLCPGLLDCKDEKRLQAVSTMECVAAGSWASAEPTAGPTESSDSSGHCLSPGPHDCSPMALQLYPFPFHQHLVPISQRGSRSGLSPCCGLSPI